MLALLKIFSFCYVDLLASICFYLVAPFIYLFIFLPWYLSAPWYFCSTVWLMCTHKECRYICWGKINKYINLCNGNFSIFLGILISPLLSESGPYSAVSMETCNYPRHQQFMLNNFSIERLCMIVAAVPPHTTPHISSISFNTMLITVFKWNVDNTNEDTPADSGAELLHNTEWWKQ